MFFLASRTPLIYLNYIYQTDLTFWVLFFAIIVNIYSYFKKKWTDLKYIIYDAVYLISQIIIFICLTEICSDLYVQYMNPHLYDFI